MRPSKREFGNVFNIFFFLQFYSHTCAHTHTHEKQRGTALLSPLTEILWK